MCSRAFDIYHKVIFADVVEMEISQWERNSKYSFVSKGFLTSKNKEDAFVIYHDKHIEPTDRDFMVKQLMDLDFQYGLDRMEKNKGEVVSAIYADHFGISIIKSNDSYLVSSGLLKQEFPEIKVRDWNYISEELSKSHKELMQIRKLVADRRPAMNKKFEQVKEEEEKNALLEKLRSKFNSNRN